MLKVFYFLKCFQEEFIINPKNFFRVIFSVRYKTSFIQTLIRERLIFNYKISFRDKYKGLNTINFYFLLTERGLKNFDLIIQLLNQYIKIIEKNLDDKQFYDKVKNKVNKGYMYVLFN